MPPINYLNPPPNPFWEFVTDMQDHPFFRAYGRPAHPERPHGAEASQEATADTDAQQANVEDPPEVDPATLKPDNEKAPEGRDMPFRGRGRFAGVFGEEAGQARGGHRGRGCGRHARREPDAAFGPPPFAFGRPPWGFFRPGPGGSFDHRGPPSPPGPGAGPHEHGQRGPYEWGHHRRGGPFHPHHGPPHRHPHHGRHGPRGPSPPHGGPQGFDLGQFLNDLGSRIGVDLKGAAQNFGLDRSGSSPNATDVDFEPRVDIFDREQDYILHLSLPGAKKEDVGVEWDGEHSLLRITGVVHRPNVDEQMLSQLVVDGRKRETGLFEKTIRLGTRREPASIDVAGIKAKMLDGVLIVTVPKVEKQHEKRDVPIGNSQTPSPQPHPEPQTQGSPTIYCEDTLMSENDDEGPAFPKITLADFGKSKDKGKQAEYEADEKARQSPGTVQADEEQLPEYIADSHATTTAAVANPTAADHDADDWEHFASDEEGEYIKINVD